MGQQQIALGYLWRTSAKTCSLHLPAIVCFSHVNVYSFV